MQCSNSENYKETQSSLKTKEMAAEVDAFLKLYNTHPDHEGPFLFRSAWGAEEPMTNPSEPLVMSENEITTQLSELRRTWISAVGEGNWFNFLASKEANNEKFAFQESLDVEKIGSISKKLNQLLDLSSRWNYLQCNLAELSLRKKKDIRALLNYEKYQSETCSGSCEESDLKTEAGKQRLINLCEVIQSDYVCELEYEQRRRSKTLTTFKSHYLAQNQEIYENFFKINVLNRWNCQKLEEKTVIEVPYFVDDIFKAKIGNEAESFEAFVERRWGNDHIQIKLIKAEAPTSDVVRVRWVDSSVSFVDYANPKVIHLSQQLSYKKLMLVFAHEIGHVLGFPDCYLEFYDRENKEAVYYDLDFDQGNLMCDIKYNSTIPEDYFNQLVSGACQN